MKFNEWWKTAEHGWNSNEKCSEYYLAEQAWKDGYIQGVKDFSEELSELIGQLDNSIKKVNDNYYHQINNLL